MTGALDAALGYAARGWPVSPWGTRGNRKFPLTGHGHLDATTDRGILEQWWTRWPGAIPAVATGEPSGVVALDIDIRPPASGFDSLGELGIAAHPEGPTTHTPQGGCAVLFRWPGYFVKTCSGELAPHLDIRGDGGSLILPPGPGRLWDPHLGPDTPLPPMPEWMRIVEPESQPIRPDGALLRPQRLSRYAETALDKAVNAVTSAPAWAASLPAAACPRDWPSRPCCGQRGRSGPTTFLAHGIPLSSTKSCAAPLPMALSGLVSLNSGARDCRLCRL